MKICVRCQTENAADYKYCKYCGTELPCVDKKPFCDEVSNEKLEPKSFESDFNNKDVSSTEMNFFIGKNNEKFVPKFINMQQHFRKTSWCWPPFLLGIVFGYIGIAAWFAYRKMHKAALIILGIGAAFSALDVIVNFSDMTALFTEMFNAVKLMLSNADFNEFSIQALSESFLDSMAQYEANSVGIFSLLSVWVGTYILPVISGLFGMHFYKKHSISKILNLKSQYGTFGDYKMRLYTTGGTSVLAVFVVIVSYAVVSNVISSVPIFAALFGIG